jgi:hypothetical protein
MQASRLSPAILFMLVISVLASSQNLSGLAASTVLYVTPTTYTASYVGENVSVKVRIDKVVSLTAYEFKLKFNTTLLHCLATQIGSFFPPPPNSVYNIIIDNNQGIVTVSARLQISINASGSGMLLGFTFNATYGSTYGWPYPQPKDACMFEILNDTLYGTGTPPQTIPHVVMKGTYSAPYDPPQLSLSLNTDNSGFFEYKVEIDGTVTGNGYPVTDALVALEVQSPHGMYVVARTLSTSAIPKQLPLKIVGLTPMSSGGTPRNDFHIGEIAYIGVTVLNNAENSYSAVVMVNLYDSSTGSLGVNFLQANFAPGLPSFVLLPFPIQSVATSGNATAYASIFSDFVENGGTPLSLESQATFTISGSAQGAPLSMDQPPQGSYGTALMIHYASQSNSTGEYAVYVATTYMEKNATQRGQLEMILGGDINNDGVVNLNDLVLLARAYGSKPGDSNWNPPADLNGDGKVSLADLVILARSYGRS